MPNTPLDWNQNVFSNVLIKTKIKPHTEETEGLMHVEE